MFPSSSDILGVRKLRGSVTERIIRAFCAAWPLVQLLPRKGDDHPWEYRESVWLYLRE
jgi:hypothetical protein